MSLYPPRREPFKKKEIFDKRVSELKHAIKNDYPKNKVVAAAEKLRIAKLNLLKGKMAQFEELSLKSKDERLGNKVWRDIEIWNRLEIDEIVERYLKND